MHLPDTVVHAEAQNVNELRTTFSPTLPTKYLDTIWCRYTYIADGSKKVLKGFGLHGLNRLRKM